MALWLQLDAALRDALAGGESLEIYLAARHSAWHVVGRVHFNLAENRKDPAAPFALPIDCLKIDKSFIDGLPDNASDLAIVRTILALGSSLHLEVVAEGVETKPQRELLAKLGVETIQGYYFSRPLPAAQVVPFFNNESECESGRRNEGETA